MEEKAVFEDKETVAQDRIRTGVPSAEFESENNPSDPEQKQCVEDADQADGTRTKYQNEEGREECVKENGSTNFDSEGESAKFNEQCHIDDDDEEDDGPDDEYNDEEREEMEKDMSAEKLEERLQQAQILKDEGNGFYRRCELPEAITCYTKALETCPVRNKKERAIFFSNRAACCVRLEKYKKAIKDCSKALELNPSYLKARLRRAECYEHEDKLEEALEDYQKVFESDRSNDVAREAIQRLPEQIKEKHEKLKEEMIGKLKDLGNLFLRPFGLSTNNFQMQQDPNTGGYSINFQK